MTSYFDDQIFDFEDENDVSNIIGHGLQPLFVAHSNLAFTDVPNYNDSTPPVFQPLTSIFFSRKFLAETS